MGKIFLISSNLYLKKLNEFIKLNKAIALYLDSISSQVGVGYNKLCIYIVIMHKFFAVLMMEVLI